MLHVLGVDIGTTGLKMGVFYDREGELILLRSFSVEYEINVYNGGLFGDIEPDKWQQAFTDGCRYLGPHLADVDAIALSGTTPGLTAMDAAGDALCSAILMLDQRSRKQARRIIEIVGWDVLLEKTGNIPVAGGCSLAGILWIKDNMPSVFEKARIFGHSNSFMARWLTGHAAMDPSSASLTGLYNTAEYEYSWNTEIADTFGIDVSRLPELMPAHKSPGRMLPSLARSLGFKKEPAVVIGGNDAVLAAYSMGVENTGEIINVNGTCEITLVCLPECLASSNYNIRAHVIPGRWLTLYVMNAGGKAFEWFKNLFLPEMSEAAFYSEFVPQSIEKWIGRNSGVTYIPYLLGSRYSQEPLTAQFQGLTIETTREELLAAMVRGLCRYQQTHLKEIEKKILLEKTIHLTGGAVNNAIVRAKRKWMHRSDYIFTEQSSMSGAAMLGRKYLDS